MAAISAHPAMVFVSQSITVTSEQGVIQVQAPAWHFIDGEPLARLKDGQSVRVDLELSVLAKPGAAAVAQHRQAFVLSYDLWEERFAVALPGKPPRSISHLTVSAAEAWCLQQLTVPVSALGSLGREAPVWIRLEYRVSNGRPPANDEGGFTLRGLIDVLSRRTSSGDASQSIEAGPFRIQE
jgi:hypothetical protein